MSRSQERAAVTVSPTSTFSQTLTCAPSAISTNKEGSQCAVGGRNLLKIYNIEEKRFSERMNLVVGPKKLNYSITDVQWHPLEENLLASAAGNGAVILWDLNKVNESKQDHLFQQHYRFVNKLCFHPTDPSLLMSCSQDGNMHCFDVRRKEVSVTFSGKTEGIRDVQFHPLDKNIFCAACESGNVQLWDIRKPDHYYNQFTAHSGPVFALHWHLEDKYWLSTGGRDNSIKIWDTQLRSHPTHIIQTIAPVNRIKWRPGYKYHIASCALVLDNNVNIWDIRRPYIPFAAFQEHTDVATGIIWQRDCDIILSCSKDKTVVHHVIGDAERPAEKAPPVALSIAPNGIIGHAFPSRHLKLAAQRGGLGPRVINPVPQPPQTRKEFRPESSTLHFHDIRTFHDLKCTLDETWLEALAQNYKFHGEPFSALCEHNAQVAQSFNLADKAQTWMILKQLYSTEVMEQQNAVVPLPSPLSMSCISNQLRNNDNISRKLGTPESFRELNMLKNDSSVSDDDDASGLHTPSGIVPNQNYNDMALVGLEVDAVFGDDDFSAQFFSAETGADEEELDRLPSEAFQIRQSFGEKTVQQSQDLNAEEENNGKLENGIAKSFALKLPKWTFESLVKDMLFYYAEQGDLQMCVTVLLALKDISRSMVELSIQEEWFLGYLEILFQLRLFNIATEIINHAPMPVNSLNQNSTTVHMQCGNCNKLLLGIKPGWYCESCQSISQVCSICHVPVKGLLVWCQGCGHGGHLHHLKEWFEKKKYCPAGCGHKCEYS